MVKIIQSKFRKIHKVKVQKLEKDFKRHVLLYGTFGIKSLEGVRLTAGQLESIRRTIKKYMKKSGNMWLRVLPDRPITGKPSEVRMGKGKGNYKESISVVKQGTIIVEVGGSLLPRKIVFLALKYASQKIPVKTSIIEFKN